MATQFARGSKCESVEVVDFEPPADSGSAARLLRSFVQICARPLVDGSSLEDFLRQTYGDAFHQQFQASTLGGGPAYQTTSEMTGRTIFLQTPRFRLQINTAIVAASERRSERHSQVERILESFSLQQTKGGKEKEVPE